MSWKAFTPVIFWLLSMAPVYSSCAGRDGNAAGSADAAAVRDGSGAPDAAAGPAGRDGAADYDDTAVPGTTYVYLCEGPMSHVYHYTQTCRGLRRCSTKLDKMTVEEAVKRGRRVCGYEK